MRRRKKAHKYHERREREEKRCRGNGNLKWRRRGDSKKIGSMAGGQRSGSCSGVHGAGTAWTGACAV